MRRCSELRLFRFFFCGGGGAADGARGCGEHGGRRGDAGACRNEGRFSVLDCWKSRGGRGRWGGGVCVWRVGGHEGQRGEGGGAGVAVLFARPSRYC